MVVVIDMIKYVQGDLFNSPAQVLVNTVNTDGVMGKGIALKFKKKYPDMFRKYQKYCESNMLDVGMLWLYNAGNKMILNFPTKKHWRHKSEYSYIEQGLKKFVDTYQDKGITSIAFPKLGCGNGGLDWSVVKGMMEFHLKDLPIEIYIYEKELDVPKEYECPMEIERFMHSDVKSLPFAVFKEDLIRVCGEGLAVEEVSQELNRVWNQLKNGRIVAESEVQVIDQVQRVGLCRAIQKLDYIVFCKVYDQESKEFTDAFQIYDIDPKERIGILK